MGFCAWENMGSGWFWGLLSQWRVLLMRKRIGLQILLQLFCFSCCCGVALFQLLPAGFAEASVLTSAFAVRCSWLHLNFASSSVHGRIVFFFIEMEFVLILHMSTCGFGSISCLLCFSASVVMCNTPFYPHHLCCSMLEPCACGCGAMQSTNKNSTRQQRQRKAAGASRLHHRLHAFSPHPNKPLRTKTTLWIL